MKASSLLLAALFALPFVVGLGDSAVWDSNEAFYVQTPREMVDSGDWIAPTFNGSPRLNKPPLAYWLVAAGYRIFGVSLLVERWIMALLALGCLMLVYLTGRLILAAPQALLAVGILATTFRFLILSRRLLIDVLLLFCILLALYFFVRWLKEESRSTLAVAGTALGLACLAKGPVAFLPLVPVALYLFSTGEWRRVLRRPADCVLAAVLMGVVSVSWFVLLGYQLGAGPVIDFLMTENLGRLTHMDFGPQRGPLYYLGVFAGDFFPWSFLFAAGLFVGLRRGAGPADSGSTDRFWLLWVASYLVLFSLSANKQEYYILPVYPAAALWLAPRLQQLLALRWLRTATATLLLAAAALVGLVAATLAGSVGWAPAFVIAAAAVPLWRRQLDGTAALLALACAAAMVVCLRPLERFQPVPRIAALFTRLDSERDHQQEARVGYYRLASPSLRFYVDRNINEVFETDAALALLSESRPAYLIMGEADYLELRDRLGSRLRVEGVEMKLYTTARTLLQGLRSEGTASPEQPWTRPVYLVSNQGTG